MGDVELDDLHSDDGIAIVRWLQCVIARVIAVILSLLLHRCFKIKL